MYEIFVKLVGITNGVLSLIFVLSLIMQYFAARKSQEERIFASFRMQSVLLLVIHFLSFVVLMNYYQFSREILILYLGSLGLMLVSHFLIDHFFANTVLPIWSITQYFLVIGIVMLARLDLDLGMKQMLMACGAYLLCFLCILAFSKLSITKYFGYPAIIVAFALLLMTNATIGGATNWLKIGNFSFQPSEVVKILYILFAASVLSQFHKKQKVSLIAVLLATSALVFIQVFQNDLGSALIYYVVFILMCYVFTTNRWYIIGGFILTVAGGALAYMRFSHVQVRVEAWLNPWADIDNRGYQIAQSLFAMGNGNIFGSGLTLGKPEKIPVVTTDFIFSAIYEEMGMIIGIALILFVLMFLLFGLMRVESNRFSFEFLLTAGLLLVLAFQSFLIIGGVSKLVPLTGVTLPFVSYGGSSLMTSFAMMGILQGCFLVKTKKAEKPIRKNHLAKRNKPILRVRWMFVAMFTVLTGYLLYFSILQSPDMVMNEYNPRLESLENSMLRGNITDRNGVLLAYSKDIGDSVIREYPFSNAFAHVVGYIDHGKSGIESIMNTTLLKTNNNPFKRLSLTFTGEKPEGNTVQLTLDSELQLLARELLGENRGAIVAMEPTTGNILAMVSTPDYNPNNISSLYESISTDNETAALLNRATQGLYPPGSTYKVMTTIAYLENNKEEDFFYYCLGQDIIGQKVLHCYNNTAHGRLDLKMAFALSCNTSYASIGQGLIPSRLKEISEAFGYNQKLDFVLESSMSQFVLDDDSSKPEISETSIGQGKTLVTPLQNLMMVTAIANDGLQMKPRLIDSVIDDNGNVLDTYEAEEGTQILSANMALLLEGYMTAASTDGTAKLLADKDYTSASKTGSAENPFGPAHAWYVGYAPLENPQIALAIVVENVGSSTVNAVPLAAELYDHYLLK